MTKEDNKAPDPTPPKDVIHTPPIMPYLPAPQQGPGRAGKAAGPTNVKSKPFDFRAAVSNAMKDDSVNQWQEEPNHMRGVSWDRHVEDNARLPTSPPRSGILQPDIGKDSDRHGEQQIPSLMARTALKPNMPPRPPSVSKRGNSTNSSSTGYSRSPVYSKRGYDSVDDPVEREAEDALIRSLEERDPIQARPTSGNNILPGVPLDQLKHDFTLDSDESLNSAPTSPRQPPPRPRLMSKDARPSMRAKPIAQTHKRQLTVEEALFGLTVALSAVQSDEKPRGARSEENGGIADSGAAADRLAATANLMFSRVKKKKDESSRSNHDSGAEDAHAAQDAAPKTTAAPQSKWGIVKANLDTYNTDTYKKTDGEDADVNVDIETDNERTVTFPEQNGSNEVNNSDFFDNGDNQSKTRKKKRFSSISPFKHLPYSEKIKNEWDTFNNFLRPRKAGIFTYARYIILYLWIPALAIAAILYHFFENPPTGKGRSAEDATEASISWWIIFLCLRQVGLLVIAKFFELIFVDFLALQTRAMLRSFGPVITLLFVQSKGWPFLISAWGILSFVLVTGDTAFSQHWLYWQDLWGLFNANNPSGDVTNGQFLSRLSAVTAFLGIAVSAKRVAIGIYQGRGTFANFSDDLAKIMNKMLQVSQIAILAQGIERKYWVEEDRFNNGHGRERSKTADKKGFSSDNLLSLIESAHTESVGVGEEVSIMGMPNNSAHTSEEMGRVIDADDVDPFTGTINEAQKARIADLLGRWEEPSRGLRQSRSISVGSVLQFRRALASMDTSIPFSGAFGLADTRENCVASAQLVYDRLMLKDHTVNGRLHFDVMAGLALQKNGELDPERAKELIRTFRPERDGSISMVDFVRSVDTVYRDLRMLRATVAASTKIDQALESIMNIVFYVTVFCIILAAYGFDPLALFLSLSSILLAFAFMIGSASAKYFEGVLFILVQRPYGIGDRINVSNAESDSSGGGAQGWIVDDVTLFTTTIYMAGTNEKATVSNGTLAKSRIINGARSHKAVLVLTLKFGIDVSYKRIELFKSAVEKFVKARPREWLSLIAIRAGRVEADLGFIEYAVVCQHRESWQNVGPILESKHAIHCFMLELTKKLNLRYTSPPLPILLNHNPAEALSTIAAKFDFEKNLNDDLSQRSDRLNGDDIPTSPDQSVKTADIRMVEAMFEGK